MKPERTVFAAAAIVYAVAFLVSAVEPVAAATPVAVFNFQMKSDTPDWKWLEKGLADRIATDFVSERVCIRPSPFIWSPRRAGSASRSSPPW